MTAAELLAPQHVGPEHNGVNMTPEEFDALDGWDEDYRFELVNGVLIVVPPPGAGERNPNEELGHWIRTFRQLLPGGSAVVATLSEQTVRVGDNRRRADRAIWIGLGRNPDLNLDVPAIIVEFVSRSRRDIRRDYVQKRTEYLEAGVREYWVIDRFRRKMTVFRPDGTTLELTESDTYRPPLMPGFELPLSKLFAEADCFPG